MHALTNFWNALECRFSRMGRAAICQRNIQLAAPFACGEGSGVSPKKALPPRAADLQPDFAFEMHERVELAAARLL